MTSNPLIAKYEEIYGKKEEPKKECSGLSPEQAEYLKNVYDATNTNIPYAPPQSVATSNTGIAAANPYPKLISYDVDSGKDSFLQIAEKVVNGEAKVVYMSVNMEHFRKSYTFEVQVYT